MGGTAFSQVLGVITLPILTRLFSPEAFGEFGLFVSITGVLSVVVCMRYELAIVLPKEEKDAANLYWISLSFTLLWTIAIGVFLLFFSKEVVQKLNIPQINSFLWLIPIGVFINGINISQNFWNTRKAFFGQLAKAQVGNAIVSNGGKLASGFSGLTSGISLIVAALAGILSSAVFLFTKTWENDSKILLTAISLTGMKKQILRYKNISVFNTSSSLLNSLSQQAPVFLLAFFFYPVTVGYYVLGRNLLKIPVNLLGQSMRKVFFLRASDSFNKTGCLSNIIIEVGVLLCIISLFAITCMIVVIAPLTPTIFGEQWIIAGQYMQWLALWVILSFISVPLSSVATILHKEHINLYFQAGSLILRVLALSTGGFYFNDPYISIILYSVAGMLYHLSFLGWIFHISKASLKDVVNQTKYLIMFTFITLLTYIFIQHKGYSILYNFALMVLFASVFIMASKKYWIPILHNQTSQS